MLNSNRKKRGFRMQSDKNKHKEKIVVKKKARRALSEWDFLSIIATGFEYFIQMFSEKDIMPFQKFLEYTGKSFDHYILKTCKAQKMKFYGGNMFLEKKPESKDIQLSADFYFQTFDRKWITTHKKGCVNIECFSDWDTDEDAVELCNKGKLELSIDPPTEE